ncbi:MAG: D-alanine--D-alanine ligase [Legionellales bacterium]|nr:D-alanine--D-alanine ligase [Legionellales bacterium]
MSKARCRVAVLYGGKSSEHEISIISAASVMAQLDPQRFDIVPIAIDKQGGWYLNALEDVFDAENKQLQLLSSRSQPLTLQLMPDTQLQLPWDIAFPVLHGHNGEDGVIQGFLETLQAPYVGCGVMGSALGMDKELTKRLAMVAGLPTLDALSFTEQDLQMRPERTLAKVEQTLGWPVFVKPVRTGSSIGIHKVSRPDDFLYYLQQALQFDHKVLVECGVDAREIELAVLENPQLDKSPLVSLPGEVLYGSQHEFYDYQAKYHDADHLQLLIPAQLDHSTQQAVTEMAATVFSTLRCNGMARVDFLLDKTSDRIYFNELNTIPGFTSMSMYPLLWEASGMKYRQLLTHLIDLAFARFERQQQMAHQWRTYLN